MLFNSAEFLLLFLPVTAGVYLLLRRRRDGLAVAWLGAASLVFYAAWEVAFLPVILGSILGNFAIAQAIRQARGQRWSWRRTWLVLGVAGNLALLFYFKYVNFFIANVNAAFGADLQWPAVVLPIGISFFTFQQISFLVDTFRGETDEPNFGRYVLYIAFFPQLIAGPIVHHREMMPQFGRPRADAWADFGEGLSLLAIGLVKKMVIADGLAVHASAVFNGAAQGAPLGMADAWIGALAYSLQIYFDFSAYSDMAIGLGRMLGIDLPINFASPYKARSIVEFWRRWHITLSRFLRDYLYFPLGGSRRGPGRQKVNLMLTMLLGGIWHGAGWTFLLWGALHGAYLLVNHAWAGTALAARLAGRRGWAAAAKVLTLLAVVVAWVPFRAADLETSLAVWKGLVDFGALTMAPTLALAGAKDSALLIIPIAGLIALAAPNAYELLAPARLGLPSPGYPATVIAPARPLWRRLLWSQAHAVAVAACFVIVFLKLNDISEFIYFQF